MNLEKLKERAAFDMTLLQWMALHGAIVLALKHPHLQADFGRGPTAMMLKGMQQGMQDMLVEAGCFTAEEMAGLERGEEPAGLNT